MKAIDNNGIDLNVEKATIFALLGQNGACKTTTIRILSTLLKPNSVAALTTIAVAVRCPWPGIQPISANP